MTKAKFEIEIHKARERQICPILSSNQTVWNSHFVKCLRIKCALFAGKTCSLAVVRSKRAPTKYNLFSTPLLKEGKTMREIAELWRVKKVE